MLRRGFNLKGKQEAEDVSPVLTVIVTSGHKYVCVHRPVQFKRGFSSRPLVSRPELRL